MRRQPVTLALVAAAALAHLSAQAQAPVPATTQAVPVAPAVDSGVAAEPGDGTVASRAAPAYGAAGSAYTLPSAPAAARPTAAAPRRRPSVFEPSVDLRAIATNNSGLTSAETRRSDLIVDLETDVRVRARGARVTLTGDVGAEFITYANRTQASRVLPRGALNLNAILVERALFFDGGVEASRTRADPLGPQLGTSSTANTLSTVSWRASPYFLRELSSDVLATARSDTVITRSSGQDAAAAAANGSTLQRGLVRIERRPVPLGMSLEASREETTYEDEAAAGLRIDSLRATVSAAVSQEWLVGVIGGRDHSVFGDSNITDSRYGLLTRWRPSARTELDADVEHRFFGLGWNARWRHRSPRSVVDLSLQRAPSATPTLGLGESASDPGALIDSLLSSRIPNEDDRSAAVDQLISSRGLAPNFSQPVQIFAESAQLAQRATVSVVLNGVRTSVFGSAYFVKAEALAGASTLVSATSFDSRQWGSSIGLYRRLAADTSGAIELDWSSVDALGVRAGDSSRQLVGTMSLSRRIGPSTTLSGGVRRLASRVTLGSASTSTRVDESQIFAGLRMQY